MPLRSVVSCNPDDVPLLANHFVNTRGRKLGKKLEIPPGVMAKLAAYSWPGNIRELHNVLERAIILSPGPELRLEDVLEASTAPSSVAPSAVGASATLEDVERQHILQTLESVGWVVEGDMVAAERLGLNPSTLRSRMDKLGVKKPY